MSSAIERLRAAAARAGRAPFPFAAPTWPGTVPRPAPERRVGLDYDHEWSRRYPVRLARAIVLDNVTRPVARVLAPSTVRGIEVLDHLEGPVIFAANHASHVDTPLLLTTLPARFRHRTVVAAAADHFFDRTWKAALWSFSLAAVPIERTRVNRRSADTAAELLERGWSLVIFPEGGRTTDGWAQPFRGGAAYLARRSGCPVVPVHIHGTRQVLPKRPSSAGRPAGGSGTENRRGHRLHRSPVTVLFGPPIVVADGEDARRLAGRIEAAVALLAGEVSSDWWTARRHAAGAVEGAGTGEGPTSGTGPATAERPVPMAALRGPDAAPWRRSWALEPARRDLPADDHPWPAD